MNETECDATLAYEDSVLAGACSEGRVELWHGLSTPARVCGKHSQGLPIAAFRGHRVRLGLSDPIKRSEIITALEVHP